MVVKISALEATGTLIRDGATLLRKIKIKASVSDSPVLSIQVHNSAAPTIGTDAPVHVIQVPAGNTVTPLAEHTFIFVGPKGGYELDTGLYLACTTTHDGSTDPTAGDEPHVTVDYAALGA